MSDPLNDVITEAYGMRQAEREDALRILAKKKSRATLIERVDETVGLGCLRLRMPRFAPILKRWRQFRANVQG